MKTKTALFRMAGKLQPPPSGIHKMSSTTLKSVEQSQVYAESLGLLHGEFLKKWYHLAKTKVFFHHFPDLVPCDFSLFPSTKEALTGQWFEAKEEVMPATGAYLK